MTQAVNSSEQFVYDVCRKSFLSLWSYVNPQGRTPGKELCDALVVCDPHVVVLSVKQVELKRANNISVKRDRWERNAVGASIKQIKGAIRSLGQAGHVIQKDGSPGLALPPLDRRVYHRIAVAFGGGREVPLGDRSETSGEFFHVLDEKSFFLLLRHLDTITDFVQYLQDKERFLSRAGVMINGGEESLLAMYLHNGREFPSKPDMVFIMDDLWDAVSQKPEFRAKLERDEESYIWDKLIEEICKCHVGPTMSQSELALRVLVRENRFARRLLGGAFRGFLELSRAGRVRSRCFRSISGVGYVFFTYDSDSTHEERGHELIGRCFASLCRFSECSTVIGIAVNRPGDPPKDGSSMDLAMLRTDDGLWPQEFLEKARFLRDKLGFFKTPNETPMQEEDEYPVIRKKRSRRGVRTS